MRKLIFALVFGVLLLPDYAFTLGMGEIEVNSALNQQLNARIELLSAAPEDAETLIVKLASREEFKRAGIDRPYILSSLKFAPYVEDGQVYIKVSTPKPVREPYLNFLIEIDWPKGHLLREYTILLDPPVYMGQAAPQTQEPSRPAMADAISQPAPVPAPQPATTDSGFRPAVTPAPATPAAQPDTAPPVPSESSVMAPAPVSYTTPYTPPDGGYRIQKGDTAWSLASRMRPDDSVSVEQMMLAMLRSNPEVFINENVNGLKRGYILRMPDRATIDAINKADALAEVRQQNALWREYQQSLTAAEPVTAMGAEGEASLYDSGSGIPSRSDARLEIVSAGSGASAAGSTKDPSEMTAAELREQLSLAREAIETERVEKEALQDQVTELEQRLDNMKGLVTIEDQEMAEMQEAATPSQLPDEVAAELEQADLDSEQAVMDALDTLTGETVEDVAEDMAEMPVAEDITAEEADLIEAEALFVDEAAEPEMAEPAPAVEPKPERPAYMPQPKPEPDLITTLLNNPLVVGGVAVVVLILGAVVYILFKRRRDAEASEVEAMLAADSGIDFDEELAEVAEQVEDEALDTAVSDKEVEASMAEAEAEAEKEFDAETTMILPSADDTVMTEALVEEAAEEERDDVIAEADVYLAYGIYQQAEELLKTAIAENPDKDAYRVKLAETYFAGKNAPELSKLATEMKQKLGGEDTPAWRKVVAMGKELCPDDDIFKAEGMVADLDIDDLMPKSPEPMDIDLGEDEGEIDASELDLDFETGIDESELKMSSMETEPSEDLSLEDTGVMSTEDTAVIEPGDTTGGTADELGELEFDLSETEAVSEPAAVAKPAAGEDEFSLDIEASELEIDESAAKQEAALDIGDMEMEADVSELDFDIGEAGEAEAAVEDLSETSLDDVSLEDLGAELEEQAEAAPAPLSEVPEPAPALDEEEELDLSDLGDVDEISTKLDLARAYLDMGDHDGARDILDEVMIDGSDQQKQEAEELLKDLG